MEIAELIDALKDVPEVRLEIFDLARALVKRSGDVDYEQALQMADRVEAALAEASGYVKATKEVAWKLSKLL